MASTDGLEISRPEIGGSGKASDYEADTEILTLSPTCSLELDPKDCVLDLAVDHSRSRVFYTSANSYIECIQILGTEAKATASGRMVSQPGGGRKLCIDPTNSDSIWVSSASGRILHFDLRSSSVTSVILGMPFLYVCCFPIPFGIILSYRKLSWAAKERVESISINNTGNLIAAVCGLHNDAWIFTEYA